MKNRVEAGIEGVNLLTASGLETHDSFTDPSDYWTKHTNYSSDNAVIKTTAQDQNAKVRHGTAAIKTYVYSQSPASTARFAEMYQTVALTAGKTYTFSAYVNTGAVNMTNQDADAAVYVEFQT